MERVSDGSIGAIDISKSRCLGLSGLKSSALLEPVWFLSRLLMSGTPLQSVKAWNFTPVTPGFGNAYFHVWHHAKLLTYCNHLFLE
jgi:hypothetical protein